MKTTNPKIGVWKCERGGEAEVFQTVKRGRHFYTKCDCCGLNQGTGAGRQQQIFDQAQFFDRAAIVIPSGVTASGAKVIEQKPEPEKIAHDFDPSQPAPEDEKSEAVAPSGGIKRFIPGLAFLAAAGVGLWMS